MTRLSINDYLTYLLYLSESPKLRQAVEMVGAAVAPAAPAVCAGVVATAVNLSNLAVFAQMVQERRAQAGPRHCLFVYINFSFKPSSTLQLTPSILSYEAAGINAHNRDGLWDEWVIVKLRKQS